VTTIPVEVHPDTAHHAPRRDRGDPCTVVLFGATGDLSRRKLLGALHELVRKDLAAQDLCVIAVDRQPLDDAGFRALAHDALVASDEIKLDEAIWARMSGRIFYVQGDLTQDAVYQAIKDRIAGVDGAPANRLFYLAVPPVIFGAIVQHLSSSGLAPRRDDPAELPWARVIVEKPFGKDLASARQLNQVVLTAFAEHQVFRIDHYLGKETVQNVLVFRAANALFEPLWNAEHIAHVQITAAETVGVEQRGGYYDSAGVVRDMFQNHLLQLFALTAMDLPRRVSSVEVGAAKLKVLEALRPLDADRDVVRGQYVAGALGGTPVPGYREEPQVAAGSTTPTYTALRLTVDNDRWRGVPFYVRSGKRLARRFTEIAIEFRRPPHLLEGLCGPTYEHPVAKNVLVHRIQPDDGITVRFAAKIPGAALELTPELEVSAVDMAFDYATAFGAETHPAYVTLLLDTMIGDSLLFPRTDLVEAGWRLTDPLLEAWDGGKGAALTTYAAGSWGPVEADALLERDGFAWRNPGRK
jgi:glucose-6-phosphate 1-dehydrogenase